MISTGDLILSGRPFAFALNSELRTKRCDFCFIPLELKISCHKCNYVYYCSRSCQRDGNKMHLHECDTLSKRPLSTLSRLVARIIAKLADNLNEYDIISGTKRRWGDLMDHYDDVLHDNDAMFVFNRIFMDLEIIFTTDLNIVELIKIYGKVLVNSFAIQDELMHPIGRSVYLGASIFDHSCDPNAAFTFIGTTVYIKAIKDIKTSDIRSNIKICYIDELDSTEERIRQLALHYYFTCDCDRCNKTNYTRIDMTEESSLREFADDFYDLELDSLAIYRSKCELKQLGYRLKNCDPEVLMHMVDGNETKRKLGHKLLDKLEQRRESVLSFRNVLSLRIGDIVSTFENNTDLALKVIDYFRIYYGRNHPRLALKLYITAMLITNNHVQKQKLLMEARNIALVIIPSSAQQLQQLRDTVPTPSSLVDSGVNCVQEKAGMERGRASVRGHHQPTQRHLLPTVPTVTCQSALSCTMSNGLQSTLLSLVDKELSTTRQQIQFKATLSNNKCRWRSQSTARDYCSNHGVTSSLTRRPALRMI